MTPKGFITAARQEEANEIAEKRPDLIHKTLRLAQDNMGIAKRIWVVNLPGEESDDRQP